MKRAIVGCVVLAAALIAMFVTGAAGAQHEADAKATGTGKSASNVFVVLLDEAPAAAYQGGVAGYPATKPAAGKKLNKNDSNVQKYVGYLRSRQGAIANSVGATRIYDYAYSLNGFAAVLNKSQVAKLRATKGVVAVERDSLSQPQTDNTPTFLGLNAGGGIWSQLGGQSQAGTDVIIGVVDTGVWPEHPSFAATGYGPPPAGWNGECRVRRAVDAEQLQQQADRRPLLQQGLRPCRRLALGRLPVGPRSRGPWNAYGLDRGRKRGRRCVDPGQELRNDQRHGASRAHRRLQGVLARGLRGQRPRRGDRYRCR